MVPLLRLATCLLLILTGICGCKPFQPGAMSRLQQPLPTSETLPGSGRATSQSRPRINRDPGSEYSSAATALPASSISARHSLADSPPAPAMATQPPAHSSQGYCASCGVTHNSSNTPASFKFSQPMPLLPSAQPITLPDQSRSDAAETEQTYSAAIRVRPLQPEEARTPRPATTRPAPPPQPDDSPSPATVENLNCTSPKSSAADAPHPSSTLVVASEATVSATGANSEQKEPNAAKTLEAASPLRSSPHPGEPSAPASADSADSSLKSSPQPAGESQPEAAVTTGESKAATTNQSPPLDLAELHATLHRLREQAHQLAAPELDARLTSELTALELLAERAGQLIEGDTLDAQAQQLCEHQISALVATLRPDSLDISRPEGRKAAAAILDHLRQAVAQLETLVSLKVTRGAFCRSVSGFGQYVPFASSEFRAGQEVLLYCELENFCAAEITRPGGHLVYSTRLSSSLVICREDGSVAQQAEFSIVEDIARNRRRDFYLHVPLTIGQLPAGKYRVNLLVDDLVGRKQAVLDPPVEFTLR